MMPPLELFIENKKSRLDKVFREDVDNKIGG